jgi:hypothetical protein
MAEEKCTVQLLGQYNLYVRETKHLSFYEYWSSKSVAWPDLAKVALYWTELQTSSIAAERAFASLRQTDMPSRVGRSHEMVARELWLRTNRALVESILKERISDAEEARRG